jgi:hypothetical protein
VTTSSLIYYTGYIAGVALPLWNIPLLIKIHQRRSSRDISVAWAFGVWGCLLLMLPAGLASPDGAYRAFTISNLVLFTAVVVEVLRFR